MNRIAQAVGTGALGLALAVLTACSGTLVGQNGGAVHPEAAGQVASTAQPAAKGCGPAPVTAAGFTKLFATAPAADVGLSVLIGSRSVWLWGDDLGRGTRSSATVQRGNCLTTSGQLLVNDSPSAIYWIRSAEALPGDRLAVTARLIRITGKGAWDFADGGFDRTSVFALTPTDTLRLASTGPLVKTPAADPGRFYRVDPAHPQHFGYSRHTHPEFALASGKTLTTTCQNFDDGALHPLAGYRLLFGEQ